MYKYNTGSTSNFYYWKENNGLEIDLLIDTGKKIIPIEIKMAQTFTDTHIKNIRHWNKITNYSEGYLQYDGEKNFPLSEKINICNWKNSMLKF